MNSERDAADDAGGRREGGSDTTAVARGRPVTLAAVGGTLPATVQFYAVVVAPLLALVVGLIGSIGIIYRLGEMRLIILVGILLMMSQHQVFELLAFVRTGGLTEPFVPELVETTANLLTAGSVYYVLSFLRDERELASELERSRKRYSELLESAPAPILVQQEGRIRYINPAGADLIGLDGAELRGRDLREFVAADDRERVERLLERTPGDGARTTDRFRISDADDNTRHIEGSTRPITYDGAPAVQMFLHDRTDREEYESQLNRTNERLETIFQNVKDAILIIDVEREEIVECNRSACELLGYHRHELVGLSPREIHPHEIERFERFLENAKRDRGRDHELSCHRKDGRTVPVEVSATTVELDGRSRILAVIRNVSERKKRERWGAILDRTLRHNLRTEINLIAGFADDLNHELSDDRLAREAKLIKEKAMSLVDIGDDLRQLRRTITRKEPGGTADLTDLVRSLVEEVEAEHPEARIEVDLPETPTLPGNELLRRAVRELIENAVEHNDKAIPEVDVRVRPAAAAEEAAYAVEIADNGPGIPDQDREVVSEDTEITTLRHGSGLGLWMVAWSVEALGGSVSIADNEPEGTVVTLRLSETRVQPDPEATDLRIVGET